jgi:gamma-glutamyl-gamma-aminobutyrate hydrolase PuuD
MASIVNDTDMLDESVLPFELELLTNSSKLASKDSSPSLDSLSDANSQIERLSRGEGADSLDLLFSPLTGILHDSGKLLFANTDEKNQPEKNFFHKPCDSIFNIAVSVDCNENQSWGYSVPLLYMTLRQRYPNANIIPLYHYFSPQYSRLTSLENHSRTSAFSVIAAAEEEKFDIESPGTEIEEPSKFAIKLLEQHDIDLLIIPGNEFDISPKFYDEALEEKTLVNPRDQSRTKFEVALAHTAMFDLGIPTFGICGGLHVMAVASGAKLNQHVDGHMAYGDDSVDFCTQTVRHTASASSSFAKALDELKRAADEDKSNYSPADVDILEMVQDDLKLVELEGHSYFEFSVNCAHHQSVKRTEAFDQNFEVVAEHAEDNEIEVIESKRGCFSGGTQFHPEVAYANNLLDGSARSKTAILTSFFKPFEKAAIQHAEKRRVLSAIKS